MATEHIVRAYDEELRKLNNTIAEMGGLAESQLGTAIEAVVTRDTELAAHVVEGDAKVDQLERDLDNLAIRLLALRQPVARDLREIFAALKIGSDLERICDYAANVAKRSIALSQTPPVRPVYASAADGAFRAAADQGCSRRLCATRRRQGVFGMDARRRARRDVFEPVPRAADLYDGRSAQHRPVHASAVHGEEHRADRRSRDQYRRKSVLSGKWNTAGGRSGRKATFRASKSSRRAAAAQ